LDNNSQAGYFNREAKIKDAWQKIENKGKKYQSGDILEYDDTDKI
jgi:hypothetical protein